MRTPARKSLHYPVAAIFAVAALSLAGCSSSGAQSGDTATSESSADTSQSTDAKAATNSEIVTVTPGVLTVALQPSDPPSSYLNDQDEPVGYNVELIQEVANDLGLEIEWKAADYTSHIPNIANGTWDTATQGALITEERLKQVDFSTPVDFAQARIIAPEDASFTKWEDASGKRIGVHTDALQLAAEDNIPDVEIVKYQDNVGMLNALRSGQIDGFVLGQNNAFNLVSENEGLTTSDPVTTGEVGIPLPKGNTALIEAVDATLDRLAASGRLAELHKQYYPDVPIPEELVAAYPEFVQ